MAATALSIASPTPRPPLVASRRMEFHIAHNSFSRWKYVAGGLLHRHHRRRSRDMLVADGIPRAKIALVNEGVDVERIVAAAGGQRPRRVFLPSHSPVVGNVARWCRTRASTT